MTSRLTRSHRHSASGLISTDQVRCAQKVTGRILPSHPAAIHYQNVSVNLVARRTRKEQRRAGNISRITSPGCRRDPAIKTECIEIH